jgi:hypothetical protein
MLRFNDLSFDSDETGGQTGGPAMVRVNPLVRAVISAPTPAPEIFLPLRS